MFNIEDYPISDYMDMAQEVLNNLELSEELDHSLGYFLLEKLGVFEVNITAFKECLYPMDGKEFVFVNYTFKNTGVKETKFIPKRKYLELLNGD